MARRRRQVETGIATAHSADLQGRENAIRASMSALFDADKALRNERAERAAEWITHNRPDLTFGAEAKVLRIAEDDNYGLADLENHGRAGDAVKLFDGEWGQIWWCDPEGRETTQHQFLVFAKGNIGETTYLLRYLAA